MRICPLKRAEGTRECVTASKQDEQVASLSGGPACVFVCSHISPLSLQWEIFTPLKAQLPWQHNEMVIERRPLRLVPVFVTPPDGLGLMLLELPQ